MGQELNKPNINKKPIDGKTKLFRYGMNEIQGWKKTMDVFTIKENDIGPDKNINIFGLFDGHSGKEISQYLSDNFISELLKNNKFINGEYNQALIGTFKNIDISLRTEEINNKLQIYSKKNKDEQRKKINDIYKTIDNENKLNENDIDNLNTFMDIIDPNNLEGIFIADFIGSSGIIILISDKITYIANAGNSHCIAINKNLGIINDKNVIEQKIYNINEKKRVKIANRIKYGKEKEYNNENEEYLYMRGFGNFQYKNNDLINIEEQEISPVPEICEIPNDNIKYLIICNSGFYEIGNNFSKNIEKNIADYFIKKLQNEQKIISDIIGDYFDDFIPKKDEKIKNFIDYNFSCIIIDFFNN